MENFEGNALSLSSSLLEVEEKEDMVNVDVAVNADVNADKENEASFSDLHSLSLPQ